MTCMVFLKTSLALTSFLFFPSVWPHVYFEDDVHNQTCSGAGSCSKNEPLHKLPKFHASERAACHHVEFSRPNIYEHIADAGLQICCPAGSNEPAASVHKMFRAICMLPACRICCKKYTHESSTGGMWGGVAWLLPGPFPSSLMG